MLHAELPSRIGGQVLALLLLGAELQEGRTHLPVGEPRGGQRRSLGDQRLEHHEPLERGATAAARLDRPGHPEPAALAELQRERAIRRRDPRVLGELRLLGRGATDVARLLLEGQQLRRQREVHRRRTYASVVGGSVQRRRLVDCWASSPSPVPRPERMRQKSTASIVISSPPPPWVKVPPTGPVRWRVQGWPWQPAPLGRRVGDDATVVLAGELHRLAGGLGDVGPVHPGVAGEDDVDEVAIFQRHLRRRRSRP